MTLHWKLVIDARDPHAQAAFWGETLGYEVEDNSALIERLLGFGAVSEAETVDFRGRRSFRDLIAVRHPDDPYDEENGTGLGRRLLFQRVPETKSGKNRLHIDVHSTPGTRDEELARLEALGATALRHVEEAGTGWVVLADPEGNEFCLH
ncbi:VOC family protein [Streptomyces aureocirculatus]|uniref:VOC family protein n=1 Tax=Streptomyces aureocirculatus TaxID=67275 RepID=UPI0004C72D12|nr:VOC family protein [Streptomyces aureocirculatus]